MMGKKLQKKYALTDKGLRNTRSGAAGRPRSARRNSTSVNSAISTGRSTAW